MQCAYNVSGAVSYIFIDLIEINQRRKTNLICAYNVPEMILGTFTYIIICLTFTKLNVWGRYYYGYGNRVSEWTAPKSQLKVLRIVF